MKFESPPHIHAISTECTSLGTLQTNPLDPYSFSEISSKHFPFITASPFCLEEIPTKASGPLRRTSSRRATRCCCASGGTWPTGCTSSTLGGTRTAGRSAARFGATLGPLRWVFWDQRKVLVGFALVCGRVMSCDKKISLDFFTQQVARHQLAFL